MSGVIRARTPSLVHTTPLRSEELFRTLAEKIPALVWVCEPNGSIRYANQRWYDYFGFDPASISQWRMREFVHPEDFGRANERWKLSLQTGLPYEVEYRARGKSGVYEWFLVRADAVSDSSGNVATWFGTSSSIEEQKRAFERQRNVADTLQEAFIPRVLPTIDRVKFDAAYFPAQIDTRIGGDWYGATALAADRIVISIGDVCGHGIDAAAAMGRVRQSILALSMDARDPAEVLEKVNRLLLLQDAPIVTAVVGFIDLPNNTLTLASAGHPGAVIVRGETLEDFTSGDIPLAVQRGATYTTRTYGLDRQTFLGLYTDGLIEANRAVVRDVARLYEAFRVAALGEMTAAQIHDEILGGTVSSDDVAILTARIMRE